MATNDEIVRDQVTLHKLLVDRIKALEDKQERLLDVVSKSDLNLEATNQHLKDTMDQFKFLTDTCDELHAEVKWLRKRLAQLLPEPNNCKCGALLIKASKKCACGHQN